MVSKVVHSMSSTCYIGRRVRLKHGAFSIGVVIGHTVIQGYWVLRVMFDGNLIAHLRMVDVIFITENE